MNRDDVPALARLIACNERVDQAGVFTDEAELAAQFEHPGLNVDRDTMVAVLPDGEPVVYAVVYPAPAARDTQRLFLSGGVRPDWRGRGLGRRMLDWQVTRAEAMHREIRPSLPALVEAGGVDRDDSKGRVLRKAGFAPVRWWYEMARDLSAPLPEADPLPSGMEVAGFIPSWTETVRHAHNEAFADHWGTVEVDEHVWAQRFSAAQGFCPSLSLVALDSGRGGGRGDGEGDGRGGGEVGAGTGTEVGGRVGGEVAAYLLSFVHQAEIAAMGVPTAHVGYLGTRPAWRGRGLGSALLSVAMRAYRDAGYTVARLVVDTENGSGALDIYRQAGFEVDRRWVTYGRQLAPIPE